MGTKLEFYVTDLYFVWFVLERDLDIDCIRFLTSHNVLHTTKSIVLILRSCDKTEVLNNNMADCVSLPDKRHDNIGDVSKLPCDNETTNSRAQR